MFGIPVKLATMSRLKTFSMVFSMLMTFHLLTTGFLDDDERCLRKMKDEVGDLHGIRTPDSCVTDRHSAR